MYPLLFLSQEWVDVKTLEVDEGGRSLITSHQLHVTLDFANFGIKESGVLFHVVEPPSRGRLDVSVWQRPDDKIFTLLDLNTDKVRHLSTSFPL